MNRLMLCTFLVIILTACTSEEVSVVTDTPTTTVVTPIPTSTNSPPTSIPPTKTPTRTPTATFTKTPTHIATATASLTTTATPTETAIPTDTPTLTPIPPTATAVPPTDTPTPTVDFRVASWRLWPLPLNSGCSKGMHTIFITVLDTQGNPLNDVIVGDLWNNVETVTGSKGVGKAEIDLWTNTMEMVIKRDVHDQPFTSEVSFPFSSFMTTIPNEQMIAAGYCANEGDCEWKRANESYYCGGHYSWEVIFQKTY